MSIERLASNRKLGKLPNILHISHGANIYLASVQARFLTAGSFEGNEIAQQQGFEFRD